MALESLLLLFLLPRLLLIFKPVVPRCASSLRQLSRSLCHCPSDCYSHSTWRFPCASFILAFVLLYNGQVGILILYADAKVAVSDAIASVEEASPRNEAHGTPKTNNRADCPIPAGSSEDQNMQGLLLRRIR